MKWFRHFNNAKDSDKIKQIIDEFGLEGYARWFMFLELACARFDGNLPTIRLHNDEFCGQIKCKHASFVNKTLCFWDKLGLTSHKIDGKFIEITIPILLELQDKDSKYNRKKLAKPSESTIPRREENIRREVEIEKVATPSPETFEKFYVPEKIMQVLMTQLMYPVDVINEIAQDAWLIYLGNADPNKNWERFISHYFKNEKEKIRNTALSISNRKKENKYESMNSSELFEALLEEEKAGWKDV